MRTLMLCTTTCLALGACATDGTDPGEDPRAGTGVHHYVARSDGYVRFDVRHVEAGRAHLRVFVADAELPIASFIHPEERAELRGYVATAAGVDYRFEVTRENGHPLAYEPLLVYAPIIDLYEPNDRPETAAVMTIQIFAHLFAGIRTLDEPSPELADWYAVDVTTSQLDVRLDDVPSNLRASLEVYAASDPTRPLGVDRGTENGEALRLTIPTTPGRYLVRVSADFTTAAVTGFATVPDNFVQPYTLWVNQ